MEMRQHSCYTAACRKTQKVISQLEHDTIDNLRSKQKSVFTQREKTHISRKAAKYMYFRACHSLRDNQRNT